MVGEGGISKIHVFVVKFASYDGAGVSRKALGMIGSYDLRGRSMGEGSGSCERGKAEKSLDRFLRGSITVFCRCGAKSMYFVRLIFGSKTGARHNLRFRIRFGVQKSFECRFLRALGVLFSFSRAAVRATVEARIRASRITT